MSYVSKGDKVVIVDKKSPYYNEIGFVYLEDGEAYYVDFGNNDKSVFIHSQLEIIAV